MQELRRLPACSQIKAAARGAVGAGAARPQSVFGGGRDSTSRRSLSHRQVHPAHLRPQEAPPVARPRRPFDLNERLSFRRQTRRFRPPSAVFFFFNSASRVLRRRSVCWLGRCPTCVRPPSASHECSGRRAAEEAASEARQQRTLLVTPWIPSSFRSITFFLGASSYHEQQRRLSLRQQQRRPPSEGASQSCFPRIFRSPQNAKEKTFGQNNSRARTQAAPRCTS